MSLYTVTAAATVSIILFIFIHLRRYSLRKRDDCQVIIMIVRSHIDRIFCYISHRVVYSMCN